MHQFSQNLFACHRNKTNSSGGIPYESNYINSGINFDCK